MSAARTLPPFNRTKTVILVPGQVEDDAIYPLRFALKSTAIWICSVPYANENPDAYIIYNRIPM